MLTTNHLEQLDPALIRPGRIDLTLEIGLAGADQVKELFLRFHPHETELAERLHAAWGERKIAPARAQQLLLGKPEPGDAYQALVSTAGAEAGVG